MVTLGWTLVEIPHTAMAVELSRDYHERSRIALWPQLLGFVGGVLFMASPMLLAVLMLCRVMHEPARRVRLQRVRFADLLLVPMLLLAWRYPLGRRAHAILARRLATRQEITV